MSDIKFRGKVKYNGNYLFANDWVFGDLIHNSNEVCIIVKEKDNYGNVTRILKVTVDPETVGQYIGVKDANGTDVYKGDVFGTQIEGYSENCVVEYDECCFVLSNGKKKRPINTQEKSIHNWLPVGTGSAGYAPFEVIGNIHDNPNLLQP